MTAQNHNPNQEKLAAEIKREIGSGRTVRFLHALPAFKLATDTPDQLKHLLDRLDDIDLPLRTQRQRRGS